MAERKNSHLLKPLEQIYRMISSSRTDSLYNQQREQQKETLLKQKYILIIKINRLRNADVLLLVYCPNELPNRGEDTSGKRTGDRIFLSVSVGVDQKVLYSLPAWMAQTKSEFFLLPTKKSIRHHELRK